MSLSAEDVLRLITTGKYKVDTGTGIVYGRGGRPITPFYKKDDTQKHLYVRFYENNQCRSMSLGKVVWIAVTHELVPEGFEVHHWDENPQNNSWINLFCLHSYHHSKLHQLNGREEIPF